MNFNDFTADWASAATKLSSLQDFKPIIRIISGRSLLGRWTFGREMVKLTGLPIEKVIEIAKRLGLI